MDNKEKKVDDMLNWIIKNFEVKFTSQILSPESTPRITNTDWNFAKAVVKAEILKNFIPKTEIKNCLEELENNLVKDSPWIGIREDEFEDFKKALLEE